MARVLQTDYKRIGRSGQTADGRVIDPNWLVEMAETYDPDLFKALIWPDHMRFQNYGSVEALRVTDNEEGGKDLWAVLSPNAFYLSDNRFGQRLFTSMEITFDFRKTGKAYLTGLGATDDPASVGTTEVRFSRYAKEAGKELSGWHEAQDKTFEQPAPSNLTQAFSDFFTQLFKTQHEDTDMADKKALDELKAEMAEIKAMFTKLAGGNTADDNQDDKVKDKDKTDPTADAFARLNERLDALEAKFSAKPDEKKATADADALKALTDKFTALETKLNDALKEQPGTDGGEHFGNNGGSETCLL